MALASIILHHIQTLNVFTEASKMSGESFSFVNQNKKAAKLPEMLLKNVSVHSMH